MMKKLLITGGTVFVSRYAATWFSSHGDYEVYVLNRNTRPQAANVTLIQADRHALKDRLQSLHFDAILDICAYREQDIKCLLDAVNDVTDYILISSSAVYPETLPQPFQEKQPTGYNPVWGSYGSDKRKAERYLFGTRSKRVCPSSSLYLWTYAKSLSGTLHLRLRLTKPKILYTT